MRKRMKLGSSSRCTTFRQQYCPRLAQVERTNCWVGSVCEVVAIAGRLPDSPIDGRLALALVTFQVVLGANWRVCVYIYLPDTHNCELTWPNDKTSQVFCRWFSLFGALENGRWPGLDGMSCGGIDRRRTPIHTYALASSSLLARNGEVKNSFACSGRGYD
jgi:hypothetical protein